MDTGRLRIRMLGEFSLSSGTQVMNDSDNRSKKVWLLLAYMIYYRSRPISQEELVNLLWGEEDRSINPLNALKTMFHRVRTALNQLSPSAGHTLIVRREGSYAWNTEIPISLDLDEFESLCKAARTAQSEDDRLALYRSALTLYQGDFLQKLSSEPWVVPIAAYFHNLYVQTVQDAIALLEAKGLKEEAIVFCRHGIQQEPYQEIFYQHLMRNLLDLGNHQEAAACYEEMRDLLFSSFGIMPSQELLVLYREATRMINDRAVSMDTLMEQLQEGGGPQGALFCEYDFFRVLYQAEARALSRSGDAVHICLLSTAGEDGTELPKRSLDRCMENLQDLIRSNLRRGDIASRCSVSQFLLMLPRANYENSCMVCSRIVKTFARQYPHSPATLHYTVQPMEPKL